MVYKIRKCQSTTISQNTQVANIDPEKFRQFGYDGYSEHEFLEFISQNTIDVKLLDSKTKEEYLKIFTYTDYSEDVKQDNWFEIGDIDESGIFESNLNTLDKNYDF